MLNPGFQREVSCDSRPRIEGGPVGQQPYWAERTPTIIRDRAAVPLAAHVHPKIATKRESGRKAGTHHESGPVKCLRGSGEARLAGMLADAILVISGSCSMARSKIGHFPHGSISMRRPDIARSKECRGFQNYLSAATRGQYETNPEVIDRRVSVTVLVPKARGSEACLGATR